MKKLIFAMALLPAIVRAELLLNEGFEEEFTDVDGNGYEYTPVDTGLGWQFFNDSGLSQSGTAWVGNAFEGEQFAFLQRNNAIVQQDFTLTTDQAVLLDFEWTARLNNNQPVGQQVEVSIISEGKIYYIDNLLAMDRAWAHASYSLGNLEAGDYTLRFRGHNLSEEDRSAYIDDVALSTSGFDSELFMMKNGYPVNGPVVGLSAIMLLLFGSRRQLIRKA